MRAPTTLRVVAWVEDAFSLALLGVMLAVLVPALIARGGTDALGWTLAAVALTLPVGLGSTSLLLLTGSLAARRANLVFQVFRGIASFPCGTVWSGVAIYFLFFDERGRRFFGSDLIPPS